MDGGDGRLRCPAVLAQGRLFTARRALGEGPPPSCGRAGVFRAGPVCELLQSMGFLSVLGALFRKPDGGADLRVGCRPQSPTTNDAALSLALVPRYQPAYPATL